MLQKGVNTWCFPAELKLAQRFEIARDADYETFEVAVEETGELTPDSSKADVLRIARAAEKNGIHLPSLACGLTWKTSPTSPDARVRSQAIRIWKKSLQIAAWLGADTLLVVPGLVDETMPYGKAMVRARNCLERVVPLAEKLGVILGVENVWNRMLTMPDEMRDFVDRFGSEAVRIYFDTGNCMISGYPEQYIDCFGSRICKVHIKDYSCSIGGWNGFVPLLIGDVNFPAVIKSLKKAGYSGPLSVEFPPTKYHSLSTVYTSSIALDMILDRHRRS